MASNQKKFYDDSSGVTLNYDELLSQVSNQGIVKTAYAFNNSLDFLVNFIKAVVHEIDLTLIDPLNPSASLNEEVNFKSIKLSSLEEFREKINSSKVKITIFTSGTTGQPKKVVHSMSTLLREVRVSEKHSDVIWGFAYNPTHMAGLQVLLQAVCNFNPLIDVFGKGKKDITNILRSQSVTHISATPTFYRLLLPVHDPLMKIRSVSLGGEKSDEKLHANIKNAFPNARVFNIYASTEAGTIFSSHGSDFKIKPYLQSKIKVENNELFLHKTLTGDYGKTDEEWYNTGDVIEWIDENNGVFKFVSRKNEMINVGGNKVNPHDVEEKILDIDGIGSCFVYGKPNALLGNMICADVVLTNDQINEVDIKKNLRGSLEAYEIPRKIKIVTSLETTRTGKLKRN
ncbi:hypothetical protein A9Q93_10485 [Nonlabens dokdonensis]|mgnify:CR=1 FL=1|uniref:Uncharacterized protein n=1 Tax=Nonlabens dokdonensis TaxID=328515 RepID=A0A1Z8APS7_9FLAO|nr:fatty acid--CoA ligase family protein [Nonlabens dokdonensis]OUS12188.1 hypothetical protein A9Q93_10485 [Nonlabens dokdonensis]